MEKQLQTCCIEITRGDIANQADMMAVVNAANAQLRPGGGVAGAIHHAAGPELDKACRPLAPIKPGEAVITKAYQLPNQYVIHCLGPVYGVDQPEDELLADCYRNALRLAEQHCVSSIAFSALSTGAFGYPIEPATEIALKTVSQMVDHLHYVKHIRFVLFSQKDCDVYKKMLEKYTHSTASCGTATGASALFIQKNAVFLPILLRRSRFCHSALRTIFSVISSLQWRVAYV